MGSVGTHNASIPIWKQGGFNLPNDSRDLYNILWLLNASIQGVGL
jgi:hypothetical protein